MTGGGQGLDRGQRRAGVRRQTCPLPRSTGPLLNRKPAVFCLSPSARSPGDTSGRRVRWSTDALNDLDRPPEALPPQVAGEDTLPGGGRQGVGRGGAHMG
ncbi:hypothetical protein HBB16_04095 [Pseudonocardia sp. MCCB 268]|nr:hypothetical protein [Pseudonocardia cytotoxica]